MASLPKSRWSREQLLAALSLYCQLPFGSMHARNPRIVEASLHIGRTPAAVALKLVNFASLDPAHQRRGVAGMSNTSVMDRQIWSEFYGRWDELANADPAGEVTEDFSERRAPSTRTDHTGRTTKRLIEVRVGQGFFRNAVIAAYGCTCCITGIREPVLLRAGHIIPWRCSTKERLNPSNGLCLNALHDAAFDRGLVAVSESLTLMISPKVRRNTPADVYGSMFERYEGKGLAAPERFAPDPAFLEYHRQHIFQR